MTDEHTIFESGYSAVLAELERNDGQLNLDVLGQACSREARATSASRGEALGWAEAAIACYSKAAESRSEGFDRQGSEVPLYGLMVLMILKWDIDADSKVRDLAKVERWIQNAIDAQDSRASFLEALAWNSSSTANQREAAVCLRERLDVGLALFENDLLPPSMWRWFHDAGLSSER